MASWAQAKRLEKNARSPGNGRHVSSLLAGTAAVAAGVTPHNTSAHNPSGLFQVKLEHTYRTKQPTAEYLLTHVCTAIAISTVTQLPGCRENFKIIIVEGKDKGNVKERGRPKSKECNGKKKNKIYDSQYDYLNILNN